MTAPTPASPGRSCLIVLAITIVACNLRPALVSVGPLLTEIRDDSGLSASGAGLLTMLPVLCFGVLAPLGPRLARRFGASAVIGAAMLVLAAGIGLRTAPSLIALFAGTIAVGGAIAVSNALLPSVIKRDFGVRSGPVLGIYAMALSVGAAVAAGVTFPLHEALDLGWRATLALWIALVAAALIAWPLAFRGRWRPSRPVGTVASPPRSLRRDPVAWAVSAFLGFGSLQFYATIAWLPTILTDQGLGEEAAGWLVALMGMTGAVTSMIVPVLATRLRGQGPIVLTTLAIYVVGWAGMLAGATSLAAVWVGLMGVAQGAALSLALTLMVVRAPDPQGSAELSGMAHFVGYTIAAFGPLLLGAAHDLDGGWTMPMALMVVVLVPMLIAGLAAARPRMIRSDRGDEAVAGPRPPAADPPAG